MVEAVPISYFRFFRSCFLWYHRPTSPNIGWRRQLDKTDDNNKRAKRDFLDVLLRSCGSASLFVFPSLLKLETDDHQQRQFDKPSLVLTFLIQRFHQSA